MSMITTTAWVRRGVAAQFPTKYEIDEVEINRISQLARMQLEDAKSGLKTAQVEEDAKQAADAMDAAEDDTPGKDVKSGQAPKK
jgi:periodic tryptophan protein 1